MDCDCMRMAVQASPEDLLFSNGHHPKCEHYKSLDLWLYEVDCGEVDTVLAKDFVQALQLANENGCNCDMDGHADEVRVIRMPIEKIMKGVFRDEDQGEVRFSDDIVRDKTPRLICSTIW